MLGLVPSDQPLPVPAAAGLSAMNIDPRVWVVNRSLGRTGTTDPLLRRRIAGQAVQTARIRGGLSRQMYLLPFRADPPVGVPAFLALT